MSNTRFHTRIYKAILMMLILVFSLSPCSVKRDLLDIFDIQHISGLNKVKTTTSASFSCDAASSIEISVSKTKVQYRYKGFSSGFYSMAVNSVEEKIFSNEYSGYSTGNSPPKYILFKRLKLSLV
ncbi:hypothetical protein EGI16_01010 [Chryseobacterium sp. G0240]|uniref:hypothetical protein n=1 Tax=Chryseobacterium sp. G0240 TaxID=2487066 RepID=UPI000F456145|nr:hypothetical protein [Chryseobacterium sp. G0240]ROI06517.1 hypothetical protein EGI16_01010 [Chryseobacterium sp. G0240]